MEKRTSKMYDDLRIILSHVFNMDDEHLNMQYVEGDGIEETSRYIGIFGDAITVYSLKTEDGITWHVDIVVPISSYPQDEPEDVDIQEYGPFNTEVECIEFIVVETAKQRMNYQLDILNIEQDFETFGL